MAIVRDLPIDEYHASPRISASKIGDYRTRGARFYHMRHVARTLPRSEPSDAQLVGQAFEDLLQRPREWSAKYVTRPDGLKYTTTEGKAWRALQQSNGKLIIDADDNRVMQHMVEAVQEHDLAQRMISACEAQVTLTGEWAGTPGVQSRPDWVCLKGIAETGFRPFVLDLKTTDSLNKLSTGRGVVEYAYDVQAAMARDLLEENGAMDPMVFLLAVEKALPHRCAVLELSCPFVDRGARIYRRTMERLARHYENDFWPRCEDAFVVVDVPAWAQDGDAA